MRWNVLESFRGQLTIWLVGLSLAAVLGVGLYIGQIATNGLAASGGEFLYASTKSAADLLATNMRERELEVEMFAKSPLITDGDLAGPVVLKAMEMRRAARSEYVWMGVADAAGNVQQATGGMLVGQQVDKRPWFQAGREAVTTGDVHEAVLLAKLLPQSSSDQPLRFIDFAAPVLDAQGHFRGVIAAHAHWSWVTQTVESVVTDQKLQRQLEVLIADRNGTILYPYKLAGQQKLPTLPTPDALYQVLRWPDGKEYVTSVVKVRASPHSDLGWQVIMRQPLSVALEPVEVMRNRLLLIGLGIALLFTALAYRFSRRFSQPIEQLVAAVKVVEGRRGEPQFPEDGHSRELTLLSRSVQSMTKTLLERKRQLAALNASLEEQVAQRTEALTRANEELERLASHDPLTGLFNRRCFDDTLRSYFLAAQRSAQPYCLLILDMDHFKRINDTHGHAVGDSVLQHLADVLMETVRTTDFVARYGGEEFVVLLPDSSDVAQGRVVAEKVRSAVASTLFPGVGAATVSVGLSCWANTDTDVQDIFVRADKALYEAKAQGRNRVMALMSATA